MESSQKTLRCPWECCQMPKGGCGAHHMCHWVARVAHGLRTHRQTCPVSGHARRTWKARGDPLCMQASHLTSNALRMLGIYLVVTACTSHVHMWHQHLPSVLGPTYTGQFYVTFVPKRTIMVNLKWSIDRIWTRYASNSASIPTCKWNIWMEFGGNIIGKCYYFQ